MIDFIKTEQDVLHPFQRVRMQNKLLIFKRYFGFSGPKHFDKVFNA
jgi:hypothetical protein